jgi:hypothetical protein
MLDTNSTGEMEPASGPAKVTKKERQYFEPTTVQLIIAICLFVLVLVVFWEIPRLPIFS